MKKDQNLFEIASEMVKEDIPEIFVSNIVRAALELKHIADLMELWSEKENKWIKERIIFEILDKLDNIHYKDKEDLEANLKYITDLKGNDTEEIYIKLNDLDAISKNIRAFKDSLLQVVNERGGIRVLARKTNIPQPSLSRFFNSNTMPHRTTLLKIAKALQLDKIKIELLWTK